jgi:hypothetical protein
MSEESWKLWVVIAREGSGLIGGWQPFEEKDKSVKRFKRSKRF